SRATHSLVRAYRVIHFDLPWLETAPVKFVPPGPDITLGFSLRDPGVAEYPGGRQFKAECALLGMHDMAVRNVCPKNLMLLQIAFQPGAVHRLFGICAGALFNQALDAVEALGPQLRRVHGRLQDARSYPQMVAIADAYIAGLADRRHRGKDFDGPLRLLRENPSISIDWLANQTSLSLRQFERSCREHTGLTPRNFARLARCTRAFMTRLNHPDRDWLSIAIDCGYFDYQHMARDFERFTGQTPARAIAMQSTAPEGLLGMPHEFDVSYPDARQFA
ncbi:MAG TPA: helix-turn-helix domain-containing protein, partial [Rhizomicrobium sp.]|nr:helix-turn-helix domain-containing protein [Rhizomicrobium sp.]